MLVTMTVIFFLVAILLVVVVLIQPGSSGGMGFIGGGSQSVFGTKTGSVITKITTVLAALFFIISLTLGYLNSKANRVEKEEMLKAKETVKELPEKKLPSEGGGFEEIGVDISKPPKK